jgi:hypothetical protein
MAVGPFVVLRDRAQRPLLAWGAHGAALRVCELGFPRLVMTADGLQDAGGIIHRACPREVIVHCGYDDSGDLGQAQRMVNQCVPQVVRGVRQGIPTLVTCAAGENRSALITAAALHQLTRESGANIFARMRDVGPQAFTNNVFRRWVLTWPALPEPVSVPFMLLAGAAAGGALAWATK